MILEELMHERFATYSFFKDQMAVYAGLPAVFYQGAPDDRQKGWEGEQYPRIVYTIDMQADEERKSAGVMQVDLYCDERKTLPEDIEPYIRKCLVNLIVKPEGNSHYAFAWARTEMFSLERSARDRGVDTMIVGASVRFDILEYSRQETANPDPVQALSRWLKNLEKESLVIGKDHIESKPEIIDRDYYRQGWIFKDEDAFQNRPDDVCYIPELSDEKYTRNDILKILAGDEELAETMFEELDWQNPESLLEDWKANSEIAWCPHCAGYVQTYDKEIEKCPVCGTELED